MGPLFCPTKKNSTVTVFFSVRLDALERCVNNGKALASAQAEAKTSDRSQTIWNISQKTNKSGNSRDIGRLHLKVSINWDSIDKKQKNWCMNRDVLIHHTLHGWAAVQTPPHWTNWFSSFPTWKRITLPDMTVQKLAVLLMNLDCLNYTCLINTSQPTDWDKKARELSMCIQNKVSDHMKTWLMLTQRFLTRRMFFWISLQRSPMESSFS